MKIATGRLASVEIDGDGLYRIKADGRWVDGGFVVHAIGMPDDPPHAGEKHIGLALQAEGETFAYALTYAVAEQMIRALTEAMQQVQAGSVRAQKAGVFGRWTAPVVTSATDLGDEALQEIVGA